MSALGATLDAEDARAPADALLAHGTSNLRVAGQWLARLPLAPAGGALAGPLVSALELARSNYGAEIMEHTRAEALLGEGRKAIKARGPGLGIEAERYIVCAGAVHSAVLLQRSGLDGGTAGSDLTLPHRILVVGRVPEPLAAGPRPGAYVFGGPDPAFPDASTPYTLSAADPGPTFLAAHTRLGVAALGSLLKDRSRLVALWVSVPEPGATVSVDRRHQIHVRRGERPETLAALQEGAAAAARLLLAEGAIEVFLPCDGAGPITGEADVAAFLDRTITAAELPMLCFAPQGGCVLGPGGTVDEDFRVRGADNVYVADASLFPSSAGMHPMVPVMALGDVLADLLL